MWHRWQLLKKCLWFPSFLHLLHFLQAVYFHTVSMTKLGQSHWQALLLWVWILLQENFTLLHFQIIFLSRQLQLKLLLHIKWAQIQFFQAKYNKTSILLAIINRIKQHIQLFDKFSFIPIYSLQSIKLCINWKSFILLTFV